MQAWEKSKAPDKIFTIENKKARQKIYQDLSWPCFFTAGWPVGSLHTFALLFSGFGSQVQRVGSAAIWRSPKYIMPVMGQPEIHPIPLKTGCDYNFHYVNIALGIYFWHAFLYKSDSAALAGFVFTS